MPFVVKDHGGEFPQAPQGLWQAVLCDQIDRGLISGYKGKMQLKVDFIWQISEKDPRTGKPHEAFKRYTQSLNDQSGLSKDLEGWLGRKLTKEERKGGMDIERFLHQNCQLQIVHEPDDDGNIRAKIIAVLPAPKNVPNLVPI